MHFENHRQNDDEPRSEMICDEDDSRDSASFHSQTQGSTVEDSAASPRSRSGQVLTGGDADTSISHFSSEPIVVHNHFSDENDPTNMAASFSSASTASPSFPDKLPKPVDINSPNKPISIYHLLLDTQLELSSDGDKIVCSKVGGNSSTNPSYPPNKRKKKSDNAASATSASSTTSGNQVASSSSSSAATTATQGTDKVRSALISLQETALNSGETERISKFFHEHYHPDCIVQLDLSKLGARHGLFIYREIRGVHGIAAYFSTTMQAIPDAVTLYWQLKDEKLPDGTRELQAKTLMVGKQLYEVEVLDDEESHSEQENIELVVAGLTSLASASSSSSSSSNNVVVNSTASKVVDESIDTTTAAAASDAASEMFCARHLGGAQASSALPSKKRKLRSLNQMNILVAQGSVDFQCGKPLPREISVSHTGVTTWTLDAEKKITKLHFVLL